jgi:hypothetical protein
VPEMTATRLPVATTSEAFFVNVRGRDCSLRRRTGSCFPS